MPYLKNHSYRDIPFSLETPLEDFFIYDVVRKLNDKCESNRDKIIKIRTVGILESKHGCFYIKEMTATHNTSTPPDPKCCIRVSMAYMNSTTTSLSLPNPVQLIGNLQWNGYPVIFAQIIQPLNVSMATLLHESMLKVSAKYSCKLHVDLDEL
ncbi:uncharacterized protein [Epargyreus clarus]|uniref:uncharacterized protein n=1 Tax=Epargyreus clarus TaxID=520877 RepID=UPI003C2B70B0